MYRIDQINPILTNFFWRISWKIKKRLRTIIIKLHNNALKNVKIKLKNEWTTKKYREIVVKTLIRWSNYLVTGTSSHGSS